MGKIITNQKYVATVTFFKEKGKRYDEAWYEFENTERMPWDVFDEIKETFKDYYKGYHMVVTFSENCINLYPFMQVASDRE